MPNIAKSFRTPKQRFVMPAAPNVTGGECPAGRVGSQAVAVGRLAFVEKVQRKLGVNATHRAATLGP